METSKVTLACVAVGVIGYLIGAASRPPTKKAETPVAVNEYAVGSIPLSRCEYIVMRPLGSKDNFRVVAHKGDCTNCVSVVKLLTAPQ